MSEFKFPQTDLNRDFILILARRTSAFKGGQIPMHVDVSKEIRKICEETVRSIRAKSPVEYEDSIDFDPQTQYLVVPLTALVARRKARRTRAVREGSEPALVELNAAARSFLQDAARVPQLTVDDLKGKSWLFYAAVFDDGTKPPTAFISRFNPYKSAKQGRLLTAFGDRLRKVNDSLLTFERTFDMILLDGALVVLRKESFESVFRDINLMRDRIPVWAEAAIGVLPLDASSANLIRQMCDASQRVAAQARAIYERGADIQLEIPALREEMIRQGIDHESLIKENALTLDEKAVPVVLKLVDEKLYVGWHTATHWDVGSRSRRSAPN